MNDELYKELNEAVKGKSLGLEDEGESLEDILELPPTFIDAPAVAGKSLGKVKFSYVDDISW